MCMLGPAEFAGGGAEKVGAILHMLQIQVLDHQGFVACGDDFTEQAQVINSASQVLLDAFGENGRHARSAIGTNTLPHASP